MYKIIGGDGKEYGPASVEQLRQWLAEGRINAQTRIQADGSSDWKSLGEFSEFSTGSLPPPIAGAPPTVPPKTSGLAIWSLVLGCLGFIGCGLTALPGLILGIVGLNKINKSGGRLGGQGLAIGGICVSGLSLLMIPILAGMLLPALSTAREKARQVQCMNNLKQIGLAFAMYADNNQDKLPAREWCDTLLQSGFLGSSRVFLCPSGDTAAKCAYVFNGNLLNGDWQGAPDTVLVVDGERGWNAVVTGPAELPPSPHRKGYNVLFSDGHVEFVLNDRVRQLHWVPGKPLELVR